MKNIYLVKYTNLREQNPYYCPDAAFTSEEEAQRYAKMQNEYAEMTKNKDYFWYYMVDLPITLRTKALISEEPLEETE